jgi:hypothetical protein
VQAAASAAAARALSGALDCGRELSERGAPPLLRLGCELRDAPPGVSTGTTAPPDDTCDPVLRAPTARLTPACRAAIARLARVRLFAQPWRNQSTLLPSLLPSWALGQGLRVCSHDTKRWRTGPRKQRNQVRRPRAMTAAPHPPCHPTSPPIHTAPWPRIRRFG